MSVLEDGPIGRFAGPWGKRCLQRGEEVVLEQSASGRNGGGTRPTIVDLGCVRKRGLGRPSARTAAVAFQFGIPLDGGETTIVERKHIRLEPGRIVLLVGPSGSGKTTALDQVERRFAGARKVRRLSFPDDAAVVDHIAPWAPLAEALSILTACGLGEAPLWVRPFGTLSDGEKFRARLARALALHARVNGAAPLLCDEFCSTLHRRVAKAMSYCLHKVATRRGLSVVVACNHDDIIADLQPHTIVRLLGRGRCEIEECQPGRQRPFSLRRRLRIERGCKRDYDAFASMHYRATDELGFVDKVFVLRDGAGGEPVGIVVYAHAPLELSMRNRVTNGLFARNPKRVNRSLRILRRLVIHPDLRGCGIGHYLVKKTLPMVGTEYVECLASMGEVNPVFEKAGMRRIGQYGLSHSRQSAVERLRAMDVDPTRPDFVRQVCRRPRVRAIVAGVVYEWYQAITAGQENRVTRQSPQFLAHTFRNLIGSRPVYYLWRRPSKK